MNGPGTEDFLVEDFEENINAFRVGVKSLNIRKVAAAKGDNSKVVLVAARHICREIKREASKVGSRIDSNRSEQNYVLLGPATASDIAKCAATVMDSHGINRATIRKDAIMAIELVFSLPRGSSVDHRTYFAECIEFTEQIFQFPVRLISAIAHLDERGGVHMHVLLIPLIDGGSGLNGDAVRKAAGTNEEINDKFYEAVARAYGLEKPLRKVRLPYQKRVQLTARLMAHLIVKCPTLLGNRAACNAIRKRLIDDPVPLALAFGVTLPPDHNVADESHPATCDDINPMSMSRVVPERANDKTPLRAITTIVGGAPNVDQPDTDGDFKRERDDYPSDQWHNGERIAPPNAKQKRRALTYAKALAAIEEVKRRHKC